MSKINEAAEVKETAAEVKETAAENKTDTAPADLFHPEGGSGCRSDNSLYSLSLKSFLSLPLRRSCHAKRQKISARAYAAPPR